MMRPSLIALASVAALTLGVIGEAANANVHTPGFVVVPRDARETDILTAYAELHRLGLRVELTAPTSVSTLIVPLAARLVPRPGTRVPLGSVVRIAPSHGPIGSPAVLKPRPRYTVPSFIGQPASDAVRWAGAHAMFWAIPNLPTRPPSSLPQLLDGYHVTAQTPPAGATIAQGVLTGRGFRPTPLTLTVAPR